MKINKILFALIIIIFSTAFSSAQSKKEMIVGLYSLDYIRGIREVYPVIIAGNISGKLSCFTEISVLNESSFPALGRVIEDSKEAESAFAETVEQGRRKNANKLVTGYISKVDEMYDHRTKSIQVSGILTVGIVDVETGNMEQQENFFFDGINNVGALLTIGMRKFGNKQKLLTVDDVLAITGEKGITKAIEKSLEDLNSQLFPFLSKYFGKYDNSCVSGSGDKSNNLNIPDIGLGNKKDKSEEFKIVNKNGSKSLLIKTNGNSKWNKMTSFDILQELVEEDLEGNTISREISLGTAKFNSYSGDYAVIDLHKKTKLNADEIVESIKSGELIYIMYHQKNRSAD